MTQPRTIAWVTTDDVWHVRVPRNVASPLLVARRALRSELAQREDITLIDPMVWEQPVRVPELDDETSSVFRENLLDEEA